MGASSLAVMANSLLLQFEGSGRHRHVPKHAASTQQQQQLQPAKGDPPGAAAADGKKQQRAAGGGADGQCSPA